MDTKNKLAPGASLLSETDNSHVSQITPMQTKKKELQDSQLVPDIDKTRADYVDRRRREKDGEVRPLS